MTQPRCANTQCQAPLIPGDQFCGECGTPISALSPVISTGTIAHSNGDGPFFSHEPPQPPGPLNNITRWLCGAAYTQDGFARKVIWHLMATRQAVAPSINFDIGPVLRHCLRARRNLLIRDLVLLGVMLLGLLISASVASAVLAWAILVGGLRRLLLRLSSGSLMVLVARLVIAVSTVSMIGFVVSIVALAIFGGFISSVAGPLGAFGGVFALVVLGGGIWATNYFFLRATYLTLTHDLRLGAEPPGPAPGDAEERIAIVEGAQRGNITLHGDHFPFIGAGRQSDTHWSIAIRLDPAPGLETRVLGLPSETNGMHIRLDPVELHSRIRDRMLALNDETLPINERIGAMEVSDRVVGLGYLLPSSPLIDRTLNTPYSHASPQAIQALIRHPQSGLRYYQQITVNDEGPTVISGGRKVLDAVDMQVAVSAFVYTAVEGHMLYLQYVLTALPPIVYKFRSIDYLPDPGSAAFGWKVRSETLKLVPGSVVSALAGLYNAAHMRITERRSAKAYEMQVGGDLGALLSVRQEGTAKEFGTYTRELDVEKYNRIFARLLVDTVRDFLAEKHIDTSAFEGSAQNIINGDVNYIRENNAEVRQFGGRGNKQGTAAPSRGSAQAR